MSTNTAPTFIVGDGRVNTDLGSYLGADFPGKLFVQPDGKIIQVGSSGYVWMNNDQDFAAVRYNADGSLDTSFAGDGKFVLDAAALGWSEWYGDAVLQADGKLLIVGTGFDNDVVAVRLNTDGTLDSSFGVNGLSHLSFSTVDGVASVKMLDDGSFLMGGSAWGNGLPNQVFALWHCNSDGSLDTGWGVGGQVLLDLSPILQSGWDPLATSATLRAITLQDDGKILAVGQSFASAWGSSQVYGVLARFNADGSLDTSFGDAGIATVPHDLTWVYKDLGSVEVLADGKILASGQIEDRMALMRFNADGSIDSSFGSDGSGIVTANSLYWRTNASFTLQDDGKILVFASTYGTLNLLRYNSDGTPDTSFGVDGAVATGYGSNSSVLCLADGRILVSGYHNNGGGVPLNGANDDFGLLRLNADGSVDNTFGVDSTLAGSYSRFVENGGGVQLDLNVQIFDAEMAAAGSYAGASVTLMRHGGANAEDSFSAGDSISALVAGSPLSVFGTAIGTVTANAGGLLTLTFASGATQYLVDTALQQIKYSNSNDIPPESVQIDWTFSDGSLTTTDSSTVLISAVNDPAEVVVPATLNFIEDTPGTITGIVASDLEDSLLGRRCTLKLTVNTGTLDASNTATVEIGRWGVGHIDLYGSLAEINAYVAAGNVSFTPDANATADVTLTTWIRDLEWAGSEKTTTLTITPVNDQPVTVAGGVLAYLENAVATAIDTGIVLSDADDGQLAGAVVTIAAGLTAGDVLGFSNTATITGSYNAATGVLTLSGTDSFENYQAALRTVSFHSTSDHPTATAATRTVSWQITDASSGASTEVSSSIEITAVNDAPSLIFSAASATLIEAGGVANATAGTASSQMSLTRSDAETSAAYASAALAASGWTTGDGGTTYTLSGTYGTATLNTATGVVAYALDNARSATQALVQGQSVSDAFAVTVSDGELSTTNWAVFGITGRNDAPVVVTPTSISHTDTSADNTFGSSAATLVASDVDAGTTLVYGISGGTVSGSSVSKTGSYGVLTLNTATGAYSYAPNDAAIEGIKSNTSESFTLTVGDGLTTSNSTLLISLTGANDPTVFGGVVSGNLTEDGTTSAGGTLTATDRDIGDAAIIAQASKLGTYGSFTLASSGAWTYTLNNAASNVQALPVGTTVSDTLVVATAGGATKNVVVSIAGTNDAPTLAAVVAASYIDTAGNDSFANTTGTLAGSDVDSGTTLSYGISGGSASGGSVSKTGSYGTLTVNSSSGAYTFVPNDAAIEGLLTAASENFTMTVSDGILTTSKTFTVNLQGANDTPQLTAPLAIAYADTAADDSFAASGGTLAGSDVDNGAVLVYGISGGTLSGSNVSKVGSYGTLTLNTATGVYSYAPNDAAIEGRKTAASESFTVTVGDGNTTTSKSLQVNLAAANDPTVFAGSATGNASENGTLKVYGKVTASDRDSGDAAIIAQPSVAGTYGTFTLAATGAWNYQLNNAATNVQALAAGETVSDTLTVSTAGGASQNVVVNIAGSNDAPTLLTPKALSYTDSAVDNVFAAKTGSLSASDVDDGSTLSYGLSGATVAGNVASLAGSFGTLALNTLTGAYTYTPNDAAIEGLRAAASESFTVTVSDGLATTSAQLKINIAAGNDTPYLQTPLSNSQIKAYAPFSYGVPAGAFADRDLADSLSYSATLADGSPLPAWLHFAAASASFSGTPGNPDAGVLQVRVTATDQAGSSVSDTYALTVSSVLNVVGTALPDVLVGTAAANTLNGLAGADTLSGGAGNDSYYVDDAGDLVIELTDGGSDTVLATLNHTLATNVEKLVLQGTQPLAGTGNEMANTLQGNAAANLLSGLAGADSLKGLGGADTLDGGSGADTLEGGSGNDVYVLDDLLDQVIEVSAGGTDLVKSGVSHGLGLEVENLTLTGALAIDGTGNLLANRLTGNTAANLLSGMAGNDSLSGGSGNDSLRGGDGNDSLTGGDGNDQLDGGAGVDSLTGGLGQDSFVFNDLASVDTLIGFNAADDIILLDHLVFAALPAGALAATAFVKGAGLTQAQDAFDRIILDSTGGGIYYDADGVGGLAAVQFASLVGGLNLKLADFSVF